MSFVQKMRKTTGLLLLAAVLALSVFVCRVQASATQQTSVIIADYDTRYLSVAPFKSDRLVPTDEAAFPYGRMFQLYPRGSNYWSGDMGLNFASASYLGGAVTLTGAEYMSVYISNQSGGEVRLGVSWQVTGNKQFTLKEQLTDYIRLDAVDGRVDRTSTLGVTGSARLFAVPAGFKGYVRIPLDESNIVSMYNDTDTSFSLAETVGFQLWTEGSGSTDTGVYMDTIALGFSDDIDVPLTLETARNGRVYVPRHDSGKYIVDGYDRSEELETQFSTVQSSETAMPSLMWAPAQTGRTGDISVADNRDWYDIHYCMLYVDNRSGVSATLSIGLTMGAAGKQNDYRVRAGVPVWLDDRGSVSQTTVAATDATDWGTGFTINAQFCGYVKIPFGDDTIEPLQAGAAFYRGNPVQAVHINASYTAPDSSRVFVDTLSVSYDDDIETAFSGRYENAPRFDTADTTANDLYIIERYYYKNKGRDYWDGYRSPFAEDNGYGNYVVYDSNYKSMTVQYGGGVKSGSGWYMWGNDNLLRYDAHDWSDAKYFVLYVTNLRSTPARFYFGVSCRVVSGDSNLTVESDSPYYLRSKTGEVQRALTSDRLFALPGSFEGWLVIPTETYGERLDLSYITRYNYWFAKDCGLTVTFGLTGYATSDRFVLGEAFEIHDATSYEYRDWKAPAPSPVRTPNEPETSLQNKTK